MIVNLTIDLSSYIADPYWPEREQLIGVQKESGMNRARSTANRRKALEEYLRSVDMTLGDYEALQTAAERPFETVGEGQIVVPKRHVDGMLVAACSTARAAQRPVPPEQVRTALRASAWLTDAHETDARKWERYVTVTAGTGARLSNQRGLRSNAYIGAEPPDDVEATKPVTATGTLDVDKAMVRPEVLERLLVWAGETVGIGASRKMGWGRFRLAGFTVEED